MADVPRAVSADIQHHVARILARRDAEVFAAATTPDAIEALAHDVLRSLKAEFVDHDGAYHAFDPDPLPGILTLIAAIRAYAETLARPASVQTEG